MPDMKETPPVYFQDITASKTPMVADVPKIV
jgi:hypothetical protein